MPDLPHARRRPRSKWDGALKFHRVLPKPKPFEGRCDACGHEGVFETYHCPGCSRFITRPPQ